MDLRQERGPEGLKIDSQRHNFTQQFVSKCP